jgi:glycosyltransferase involved in cell wall biosynthesis
MTKVTVGIPVYNADKTIEKTILSLVKIPDIRIHISDNNSNDLTSEICNRYAARYSNIKYTKHKKNLGGKFNFEYALKKAKTDYFMWLGGDDYLSNINLSEASKLFNDKNTVAISFNSYFYYPRVFVRDKGNRSLTGNKFKRLLLLFLFPGANSRFYSLFRRKELLKLLSNENYWGSDMAFSARVAMKGNWAFWEKGRLIRHPGPSSNPIICRRNGGVKGIFIFFPIPIFFKDVFKASGFLLGLLISPVLLIYYFRLLVSPIKAALVSMLKKLN